MGPQPNSCGNGAGAKRLARLGLIASMGPQPNSCGNARFLAVMPLPTLLQWGHSQTAVETSCSRAAAARANPGFNGATAKQLWKRELLGERRLADLLASMGPQPNSCGNHPGWG